MDWALQAPLSTEFSRQEYWSGLPFSSPGNLPNPGIEPRSPVLQADSSPSEPPAKEVEPYRGNLEERKQALILHLWRGDAGVHHQSVSRSGGTAPAPTHKRCLMTQRTKNSYCVRCNCRIRFMHFRVHTSSPHNCNGKFLSRIGSRIGSHFLFSFWGDFRKKLEGCQQFSEDQY